ncbi:hypothetical protein ACWD4V_04450 [Streptomyces tsukubensis]
MPYDTQQPPLGATVRAARSATDPDWEPGAEPGWGGAPGRGPAAP